MCLLLFYLLLLNCWQPSVGLGPSMLLLKISDSIFSDVNLSGQFSFLKKNIKLYTRCCYVFNVELWYNSGVIKCKQFFFINLNIS